LHYRALKVKKSLVFPYARELRTKRNPQNGTREKIVVS